MSKKQNGPVHIKVENTISAPLDAKKSSIVIQKNMQKKIDVKKHLIMP